MKRAAISTHEVIRQLRLPLIVLVTFAHSYSGVRSGYTLPDCGWDAYEVLKLLISQTLAKVAMPTFFVISGYLFFANVEVWNYQVYLHKIKRRIKTLLIPYLLWNALMGIKLREISFDMFWVYSQEAGRQIDWLGNVQLMTAPANMPLWFLRDLMVVSLLAPIIYMGIRKWGVGLIIILTPLYLSGICAFVPGLSAYAIYFFSLGATLSIKKMDLVSSIMHYEKTSYFLSITLGIAMIYAFRMPIFSSLMLWFRMTSVIAVICLTYRILLATTMRIPQTISDASYFIYLTHYVFFLACIDSAFFSIFGQSSISFCFHYLLCPFIKAVVSIAIYCSYRKAIAFISKQW